MSNNIATTPSTPHPEYTASLSMWEKCRDALEGEDKIKQQGLVYLPMLGGQDISEYNAYKARATYYNATRRTVSGLVGAVMRKPPEIKVPDKLDFLLGSFGSDGEHIEVFAEKLLTEVLSLGRVGVLVDVADGDTPYVAIYYAENIINWREQRIGGRKILTLLVLQEAHEEPNGFAVETKRQLRVFVLQDAETANPTVLFQLYRQKTAGAATAEDWLLVEERVLAAAGGKALNEIPFVFVSPCGLSSRVERSPILDLININLSHYRTSADLEHGRHFTALPTAWAAGFSIKQTYKIGSSVVWVSDDPNAHAGFLEFTGAGLASLREALEQKQGQMAVLGARLLEESRPGVEAAETVKLRHSGESGSLLTVAHAVSDGIKKALRFAYFWQSGSFEAEIVFDLNDEFLPGNLDAQKITAMVSALQSGAMSFEAYFYNLSRAGMYPEDWTLDDERASLLATTTLPEPAPAPEARAGSNPQPDTPAANGA